MHARDNKTAHSQAASSTSSKGWLFWLLVTLVGTSGIALLLCCGIGAWLARLGITQSEFQIESQLRAHPQIVAQIGPIQSLNANLSKSIQGESGDQIWVYDLEGTDGRAELIVDSKYVASEDREVIKSAVLRLTNGEEIQLDLPSPSI